MIEIRPILDSEADAFLRVMCEVFELDYTRSTHVFYNEPFFDLKTKWALFEDREIVSIATLTPLQFGWGRTYGIAGVGTTSPHRRKGRAEQLLKHIVLSDPTTPMILFAVESSLYERVGFQVLDEVVRAPLTSSNQFDQDEPLPINKVKEIYSAWSSKEDRILKRDQKKWDHWAWSMRTCYPLGDGYFCDEPRTIREFVSNHQFDAWPVPDGCEWHGLKGTADYIAAPIQDPKTDMYLMGLKTPEVPIIFLTDQF